MTTPPNAHGERTRPMASITITKIGRTKKHEAIGPQAKSKELEDPFAQPEHSGDDRSQDPRNQGQDDLEQYDAFAPGGNHDTRNSRHAPSPWAQLYDQHQTTWDQRTPAIATPMISQTVSRRAYSGLNDMLDRGRARLTNTNTISSKLKWQPRNGKDK